MQKTDLSQPFNLADLEPPVIDPAPDAVNVDRTLITDLVGGPILEDPNPLTTTADPSGD